MSNHSVMRTCRRAHATVCGWDTGRYRYGMKVWYGRYANIRYLIVNATDEGNNVRYDHACPHENQRKLRMKTSLSKMRLWYHNISSSPIFFEYPWHSCVYWICENTNRHQLCLPWDRSHTFPKTPVIKMTPQNPKPHLRTMTPWMPKRNNTSGWSKQISQISLQPNPT